MTLYFGFIAGMLAGFAAALVAMPLLRGALTSIGRRNVRIGIAAGGVAAFGAAAFGLYHALGSPDLLARQTAAPAATPHPGVAAGGAGEAAGSMDAAVAKLEARLSREGGRREDWLLLAQSYDFLGRAADAERARAKAEGREPDAPFEVMRAADGASANNADLAARSAAAAGADRFAESGRGAGAARGADSGPSAAAETDRVARPGLSAAQLANVAQALATSERRAQSQPSSVEAWRSLAAEYRKRHDYAKARDAFAKLVQLQGMTADTWADYADVLASLSGNSLRGEAARAIDHALALDPEHAKALWLKASLAHEEHRYADALDVWMKLRAVLPAGSPDVQIVEANIAEARELAGSPAPVARHEAAAAEVSGTISIDSKLAGRVPAGAVLFIYAKAADSPGPPLAVLRQPAGAWPVAFRLDDTLAMIPTRKLSQFDRVIVEARISRSGQATPAAGDLYVTSAVLKPGAGRKIQLVIAREVS